MQTTPHSWRVFDASTPVLIYEYSFGPGVANALAVAGNDGLVVVSPPCRVAPGVFDDLAQYGPVRALVASNAFHYLGIPEWKARFTDAAIFAPAQSIARVGEAVEAAWYPAARRSRGYRRTAARARGHAALQDR